MFWAVLNLVFAIILMFEGCSMSQPKILFVCDKNECTSFGRLTLNLVKAVSGKFDAHVLWLKTPKFFGDAGKTNVATSQDPNYVSHEVWAKSLYTGFASFRSPLKKLVKKIQPEMVFFIRPELGFLVPVVKGRAKTVMFVHDTFAETLYPDSMKFKLLNLFYIRPTVKADFFVYNSDWTREQAAAHFGQNQTEEDAFIYWNEDPIIAAELRKYGIKNFDGMCLNVSLDEPRKNIETFFEMASLRPHVAFVRVGKFSEHLRAIVNAKKLYNVYHFSEFKAHELRDFYRHADLMVYPSLLEGFGLPPIEAIACGTPAVGAATSAIKENLDGVCPLINPPTDAEAYARVIDRVLAGENVVDESNAKKLLEHCSMESFSKRVINFFNSISGATP